MRKVTVAGGGELQSEAMALNCKFNIQGQQLAANFRILHLPGSDIILGVNWSKYHNPVTFDFIGRTLTMEISGQPHTFVDHLMPPDKLFISAEECASLMDKGATGYVLFPPEDNSKVTPLEAMATDTYLTDLLHQFQDLFQQPSG